MRKLVWITSFLLAFPLVCFAGTKDEERPDREMLRLMELLRQWDMIKNLDLMRQMDNVNRLNELTSEQRFQSSQPGKTKDRPK